jgi:hypothetical protein
MSLAVSEPFVVKAVNLKNWNLELFFYLKIRAMGISRNSNRNFQFNLENGNLKVSDVKLVFIVRNYLVTQNQIFNHSTLGLQE